VVSRIIVVDGSALTLLGSWCQSGFVRGLKMLLGSPLVFLGAPMWFHEEVWLKVLPLALSGPNGFGD